MPVHCICRALSVTLSWYDVKYYNWYVSHTPIHPYDDLSVQVTDAAAKQPKDNRIAADGKAAENNISGYVCPVDSQPPCCSQLTALPHRLHCQWTCGHQTGGCRQVQQLHCCSCMTSCQSHTLSMINAPNPLLHRSGSFGTVAKYDATEKPQAT